MKPSWRIWAQKTAALEKSYVPKIRKIIRDLRATVIADLKASGPQTAISNLQLTSVDMLPLLHDIYRRAGLMGARMTYSEIREAVKVTEAKAAALGRNENWIAEVRRYLALNGLQMAQEITGTMKDDILKVLDKAAEEGWSIDTIVLALRETKLVEARARTIARTEVVRAANVGHSVAAKSLPYEVEKEWSAGKDHRTRHSHVFVNGHTVDENGFFKVPIYKGDKPTGQFDEMQFPGDPKASASNTINCRCRVLYNPKRDANGRLIMRNPNQATVIPMRSPQSIPASSIAAILKENIYIGIEK